MSKQDIKVVNIPRGNQLVRLLKLRKLVAELELEILQGLNFYVNGYAVLAKFPYVGKVIGGLRNLPIPSHTHKVPGWWRWLCFAKVGHLVCNSESSRLLLGETYPNINNSLTISNAIVVPESLVVSTLRSRVRAELDIEDIQPIIGFVGNLTKQKNVPLLIKAIGTVVSEFPELKVVVIGDGPMRSDIDSLISELGIQNQVVMLGRKDNGVDYMPAFDLLCLPSDYEGMPNVLMEAGSAGIPVVATRVAGNPEVVKDGETGTLVPVGDHQKLADAISDLLRNREKARKMGAEARKYMIEKFSIGKMVDQYQSLYERVARC